MIAGRPPTLETSDRRMLTRFEVLDGKQRLTTSFLMPDRIRRRFERLDSVQVPSATQRAAEIRNTYGFTIIDLVTHPFLRLGKGPNESWVDSVLNEGR